MKTAILFILFAGLLLAAGGPTPRKAPAFRIQTGEKKYISLSQYAGKTIVLAFILTDCSHCEVMTKILNKIQKDYAAQGVQVLESALDVMASMRVADFQKKLETTFPVGFNTSDEGVKFMEYAPGVPVLMPVVLFIDRNGTIRKQFDNGDRAMLEADKEKNLRFALDQTISQGQEPSRLPAPAEKKTP